MKLVPFTSAQLQDTMSRLAYFEGWDKEQLARLAAGAKQIALARKESLAAKGSVLNVLHVVISGQLRLYIPLSNGAERVVAMVEQGQSFGEPCLIRGEPCPYEVVAGKDCHLLVIDAMVYRRELRASPVMAEHTMQLIAARLLHTLRDIEICAQPSSLQRVAHFLIHLHPPGTDPAREFRLPALKRDIAGKLGLSQETFSRMLAFMAQQGFIQLSGNQLVVDDWSLVHGLARGGCPMEAGVRN